MKRTILALALASFSIAAFALPPPGGVPPVGGTLDVNVTNSVVPVEVSNAYPIDVREMGVASRQLFRFAGNTSSSLLVFTVPAGKRLTIEQISWVCQTLVGNECIKARLTAVSFSGEIMEQRDRHFIRINPSQTAASGSYHYQSGSEQTRLYFTAGELIYFTPLMATTPTSGEDVAIAMHGYLETL